MATNYPPYVQPITTITNESTYYFGSSFNSFSGSTNNQNEKYFTSVFIPELNWIVYVAYRAVNIIIVNASTNQIVKSIYTNLNAKHEKIHKLCLCSFIEQNLFHAFRYLQLWHL